MGVLTGCGGGGGDPTPAPTGVPTPAPPATPAPTPKPPPTPAPTLPPTDADAKGVCSWTDAPPEGGRIIHIAETKCDEKARQVDLDTITISEQPPIKLVGTETCDSAI